MKRNMGHSGCSVLAQALESHVTGKTVAAWEHKLSCTLLASSRAWFAANYSHVRRMLLEYPGNPEGLGEGCYFSFEVVSIRADATNSSTLQSSKAHVAEVRAEFAHLVLPPAVDPLAAPGNADPDQSDADPDTLPPEIPASHICHTQYTDLLRVPDHCTGER
eukprot:2117627-Alexandrium_andersonii.AAC.1